jgi:molybdate transport system permease protein
MRISTTIWQAAMWTAAACLVAFVLLPVLALLATTGVAGFLAGLRDPLVWPALRLSLITTVISLAVIVGLGTPLAWQLASRRGRVARAVETLLQLPVVIPPAVAGLTLLLTFGRRGLLGPALEPLGWAIPFTTAAVVLAEVFVAAPFYVQAATTAFRRIDPGLFVVARSLGASPARVFFRVAVPLARAGLVGGAAMAWARALGEFGATLMFAGNFTGRTQTLPLAIYTALESNLDAARALSVVLVMVAFGLLLLLHARGTGGPAARVVAGPGAAPAATPGATPGSAPGAREP